MKVVISLLILLPLAYFIREIYRGYKAFIPHIRQGNSANSLPDALGSLVRSRREYYREVYLKSDNWKRKRYVVLKRDRWTCVHCGQRATQVHHKRYAPKNIGREPIEWLESVCNSCHQQLHS